MKVIKKNIFMVLLCFIVCGCAHTRSNFQGFQKQAIETDFIQGEYEKIFKSAKTVLLNQGFNLEQVSIESGFIKSSFKIKPKSAIAAGFLSVLPGGGSLYTEMYGLGAFDMITWPWSIVWDMPISMLKAASMIDVVPLTVCLMEKQDGADVRITCNLMEKKHKKYGVDLKRMFIEIKKQVLILG